MALSRRILLSRLSKAPEEHLYVTLMFETRLSGPLFTGSIALKIYRIRPYNNETEPRLTDFLSQCYDYLRVSNFST